MNKKIGIALLSVLTIGLIFFFPFKTSPGNFGGEMLGKSLNVITYVLILFSCYLNLKNLAKSRNEKEKK